MALSRIGPFNFVSLSAPPPPQVGQVIRIRTRPGIDNFQAQRVGRIQERPFITRSLADTITGDGALELMHMYVEWQASLALPVSVKWGRQIYDNFGITFIVEHVDIVSAGDVLLGVGGINGTSKGRVVADWTLRAIKGT